MNEVSKERPLDLQPHHMGWILDWALEACVVKIDRVEMQIIQHERFINEPIASPLGFKRRVDKLDDCRRSLALYRDIYTFLVRARSDLSTKNAEQFGRDMAAMFRGRK